MEKLIEVYNSIHGNKYNYSHSDFNLLKIKIECPEHGIFEQNKYSHKKYGCWKCSVEYRSKSQRMSKEEFEIKSRKVHGNKYEYSKVDYINNNTKVLILCSKHGEFKQIPSSHLQGNGCPKCGTESMVQLQSMTTDNFLKKSLKIHENKYDYSLVNYFNQKQKIKIICKIHGVFEQLPHNHLKGYGCPKCNGKFLTNQEFILKCVGKHGNKYDYSLVNYEKSDSLIEIKCKTHGIFKQKATNHLNDGNGCPKCYNKNNPSDTKKFITDSKKKHGDRYDYSMVNYENAKKPVIIICKKHGKFEQTPTHHKSGQGCPICKSSKGENKVYKILSENNILFEHHSKLKNSKLEFDFYLSELNIAIEYDGIQHFKPINHFGGISAFKEQQRRDSDKNQYCIDNNIKLIRIPYNEDVESILKMQLFN